ncbi:MAG: hypothetical protein ACRDOY_05070, partial [Nocardioidaceae bacterium]
ETVLPAVNDTLETVGDVVQETLPAVDDTVDQVGETVGDLLGALEGQSLLDLDADLDLDLDLAAPVSAAVAANANAAIPIDAAVSANALSPDSVSQGIADQDAVLQQLLAGDAIATTTQDSAINQGEINEDVAPTANDDVVPTPDGDVLAAPASLLDLDVDLDLALDLAAPIDAAIAANANIAAPIDAAVSANILSPNSVSLASADQDVMITQTLQGLAQATSTQTSTIDQGQVAP